MTLVGIHLNSRLTEASHLVAQSHVIKLSGKLNTLLKLCNLFSFFIMFIVLLVNFFDCDLLQKLQYQLKILPGNLQLHSKQSFYVFVIFNFEWNCSLYSTVNFMQILRISLSNNIVGFFQLSQLRGITSYNYIAHQLNKWVFFFLHKRILTRLMYTHLVAV